MRLLPRPGPALPVGGRSRSSDGESAAPLSRLSEGVSRKEPGAIEELYEACAGRAFGLAYRVLGDGPAAEDAVHDAFLWLWEHAERVDVRRGDAEALVLTVARRRAIDQLRKRTRQGAGQRSLEDVEARVDGEAAAVLARIGIEVAGARLHEALRGLQADQREAVELAFFGGMTHRQIADARDLPLGTVKSRLRLAMERLRAALKAEDYR